MQFVDNVNILIKAGDGGNGSAAGRREKHIPYGGPAGGDGGKGGDVILRATNQLTSLEKFLYQTRRTAPDGGHGQSQQKIGNDGEELIIDVPIGTVIRESAQKEQGKELDRKIVAELTQDGDALLVARGGKGGWGNTHFTSPQTQFPSFALLGEPGEQKRLHLELQLSTDIGLVGMPNVGKSTLLGKITNAKAKVASYPFTTVVPNIGVHQAGDKGENITFSLVDTPGLLENASRGVGMGYDFLQHTLRSKMLLMLADAQEDYLSQRNILRNEYTTFLQKRFAPFEVLVQTEKDSVKVFIQQDDKPILFQQRILFVLNKIDTEDMYQNLRETQKKIILNTLSKKIEVKIVESHVYAISGETGLGVQWLLDKVTTLLPLLHTQFQKPELHVSTPQAVVRDVTQDHIDHLIQNHYIKQTDQESVREVDYPEFAYWVYILPRGNDEAEQRFWQYMVKQGFLKKLQRQGVKKNDILYIHSPYFSREDVYIRWE